MTNSTTGAPIGSALIDIRVQHLLIDRLRHVERLLPQPIEIAEKMMQGRFERFKCSFGTSGFDVPDLPLDVPGLPPGTDIPMAGIQNSQIRITQLAGLY